MTAAEATVEHPLVSIIVPAYNAEATLAETVHSALASTYEHIEVIIVDDGSTDATGEVAAQLAADARVRVVTQSNRGLPGALNAAIAAAAGEFIARLDADDLWHPTKLAKQLGLALGDHGADFIYTHYRYIDRQGRVLFDGPPQRFPRRALRRSVYETLIGTGSSMLMRKGAVEQLGGFDETYRNSEDLLFQVRMAAAHTIDFVPEYLVGYRLNPKSVSSDLAAMRNVWCRLRPALKTEFPQVADRIHDWAHARRCMHMAEGFARRGQFAEATRMAAKAARFDPAWSWRFLAYRAGRFLRKRMSGSGHGAPGLHFLEYRPEEAKDQNSTLYGTEGRLLGRLHERRVALISALDEQHHTSGLSAPNDRPASG